MNPYDDLNDYELVSLAQELNEDAINLLHQKYQPLIKKKCHKYLKYLQNKGIEMEDLTQECMLGLEEAIKNFKQNDEGSFYTFVNICMDRQLITTLKIQNRERHKPLNDAISLDSVDDETDNLIELIQDNSKNPELSLFSNEEFNRLYITVCEELADLEECVFKLKIQGFSYKEIADILDKDYKSIYNTAGRIKLKIKELMDKNTY